jgi:hypothetical protein
MATMNGLTPADVYDDLKKLIKHARSDQTRITFIRTIQYEIIGCAGPTRLICWGPTGNIASGNDAAIRTAFFLAEALEFALAEIERHRWVIRRVGLRRGGLQLYCRAESGAGPIMHIDVAALTYVEFNVGPGFDDEAGIIPPALLSIGE